MIIVSVCRLDQWGVQCYINPAINSLWSNTTSSLTRMEMESLSKGLAIATHSEEPEDPFQLCGVERGEEG
jgi:hypothetical protein